MLALNELLRKRESGISYSKESVDSLILVAFPDNKKSIFKYSEGM